MQKSCAYCTLPEIQARVLTKNEYAWAFLTNIPIVPGHTLICPVRCVPTLDELTDPELHALFEMREKLKSALAKTFGAEGFNYAWNEGEVAGQNVPHLHLHMLPRKKGDTGITKYEPRKFLYRPGSRQPNPEDELREVAEFIRRAL